MTERTESVARWQDRVFEGAVIVSVLVGALYGFGWIYWESFLSRFGISATFLDHGFENVIATTWTQALRIAVICTVIVLNLSAAKRWGRGPLPFHLAGAAISLCWITFLFFTLCRAFFGHEPVFYAAFTIAGGTVAFFSQRELSSEWDKFATLTKSPAFSSFVVFLCLATASSFYHLAGRVDGDTLRAGPPGSQVALLHNDPSLALAQGTLVGFFKGNYMVHGRHAESGAYAVEVVRSDDVSLALLWPGIKRSYARPTTSAPFVEGMREYVLQERERKIASTLAERTEYASRHVKFSEVSVKSFGDSAASPRTATVAGTITNTGDRPISSLWVRVLFLDETGQPIHEREERVVDSSDPECFDGSPLRMRYVRQFEVTVHSCPAEWRKGDVRVEPARLEFEGQEGPDLR